jgi:hypothetical protein
MSTFQYLDFDKNADTCVLTGTPSYNPLKLDLALFV